jgi:FtsH-binding integral membrane protein
MNKAFLIILVPAILVALWWLTIGWGTRVSLPVGVVMMAVLFGCVFLILRRQGRKTETGR